MRCPLFMTLACLTACGEGAVDSTSTAESGALTVPWQVGAAGCEASGVASVRVDVAGTSSTAACSAGSLTLEVRPGDHRVDVWGLDEAGFARYGGSDEVSVAQGDVVTMPTVVLGALPATLDVSWYFDNGRLCGGNGVTDVEIIIFEDDFIIDSLQTSCDDGIERMNDLLAGNYTVSVLGRDSGGVVAWTGLTLVEIDKGDLGFVEVELSMD
jgi:hypothetical protein